MVSFFVGTAKPAIVLRRHREAFSSSVDIAELSFFVDTKIFITSFVDTAKIFRPSTTLRTRRPWFKGTCTSELKRVGWPRSPSLTLRSCVFSLRGHFLLGCPFSLLLRSFRSSSIRKLYRPSSISRSAGSTSIRPEGRRARNPLRNIYICPVYAAFDGIKMLIGRVSLLC